MFGDYIRRLSESRFWLSKWFMAAAVAVVVLLFGIIQLVRSGIDFDTFLNYFALGLLIFVLVTVFYGIIAIHDVPYDIAVHRNHPHQDAIHAAGWVSLFTLHAIWPFLWIWAMLYRPDRGWGMSGVTTTVTNATEDTTLKAQAAAIERLNKRLVELEHRLPKGGR